MEVIEWCICMGWFVVLVIQKEAWGYATVDRRATRRKPSYMELEQGNRSLRKEATFTGFLVVFVIAMLVGTGLQNGLHLPAEQYCDRALARSAAAVKISISMGDAAGTCGPSATSPDSFTCSQVTRWDQPFPWEQADYEAQQAQAQQRALLTLLGGMNRVVASTVRQGSAIAGELAASGAASAAQLQQFVAEAAELGAAAASLMAKAVASFAPAPQYEGPQPERFYLQQQQQQQQQQEPAMHPLAFHKLALAATHPQLWAQMSVEVPLHHAAHQAQQQMQQGLDAVAFLSGVTPAATAVMTPRVYSTVADMASSLTASLSLHQRTEQGPRESLNAATIAANTTCTYDETPYVPVPAPAPAPEQCPLPTLQVLVSCADATAAAPAAAADSISCPMCSTCSECSTQESLWVSATADELLGLDAVGVAPTADAIYHTVSAVSGKTVMAVEAVATIVSPTISWAKRVAQPVASHPNMQLVVSKVTDWSSGLRFTVASLALRLSTVTSVYRH